MANKLILLRKRHVIFRAFHANFNHVILKMIPWPKLEGSHSKGTIGQALPPISAAWVQIFCCYCQNRQEGLAQGALRVADIQHVFSEQSQLICHSSGGCGAGSFRNQLCQSMTPDQVSTSHQHFLQHFQLTLPFGTSRQHFPLAFPVSTSVSTSRQHFPLALPVSTSRQHFSLALPVTALII